MTRSALSIAAAAALAIGSGVCPALAQTDEATGENIYIAAFRDDAKPVVVFVFSDAAQTGFAPKDAIALYADPEYTPGEKFEPTEACKFTLDYEPEIDERFRQTPIYGPASSQRAVSVIDLPSFMAREAAKVMLSEKLVASEAEAVPTFNCAGFVWALLMEQPEEVWREIIERAKAELPKPQ